MRIKSAVHGAIKGAALLLAGLLAFCPLGASAQNLPPTWVFARAYNGWNIIGQQANTYTFNGGACNYAPYNGGNSPSFFVFSGLQGTTTVYNPVLITDANSSLSEIVTPTSTTQSAATCGFAASTTNQHTSFTLSSGTVGLQEAVTNQLQSAPPSNVMLDQYWYTLVFGLPGSPTPESLIKAVKGSPNVAIVDTTTTPWTYWRSNSGGTAYAAVSLSGGTTLPTAAAGAAAGTSPTGPTNTGDPNTFTVALTTGTATPTGTLFTETWPVVGSGGFAYPPTCRVYSTPSQTNQFTAFTYAVTKPTTQAILTVTATTAPTASTAYGFTVICN
jgi:hypothetical protein